MNTTCPHCTTSYSAPSTYLNKTITCPHCQQPYTLTAHSQQQQTPLPQQQYPSNHRLCTTCHTIAKPKLHTPGHILIELTLWLAFIIPGLLYSLYRLTNRKKTCPTCLTPNPIPLTSPAAKQHLT